MATKDESLSDDAATREESSDDTLEGRQVSRHEVRQLRAQQLRRALTLTGLSTLWPGIGLIPTRRRWLGIALALASAATLIVVLFMVMNGGIVTGAARFATKRGLLSLLVLFIVGALLWVGGILLTAKETSGRRWSPRMRWVHRVFTAAMVLIVALPAAQAARYVVVTQNAFNKIFTDRYAGRGGEARGPSGGSDPWKNVPRVNVLLLGSDAGKGRINVRTDSMMVVSVNTKTGDSTLISIPRNLQRVPFPTNNPLHKVYPKGFHCPERGNGQECLMDAVWVEADSVHRDLFPKDEANPGLDTTREVISEITGLHIDYTTVVDLSGFQQLVDAMGGVYINVPGPEPGIPIGGSLTSWGTVRPGSITGYIKPGYQKLDGRLALWYSRSRVASTDDDRMRRQRCMVNALVDQADPFKMVTKFTDVMKVAEKNIQIDIPQDDLPAFATLVNTMKKGNLLTANVTDSVSHVTPDFNKIRSIVQSAINRPHNPTAPKPGSTATTSTATPSTTSTPTTAPSSTTTSVDPVTDTAAHC